MSKAKKNIPLQFRVLPDADSETLYNTTHFRFDSYDGETGERTGVSNLFAVSVVHTDPMFDLVNGVAYVDVGLAYCNGDNFDRSTGASLAHVRLLERGEDVVRLMFRVDEDAEDTKPLALAASWSKKLQSADGRREVYGLIRDAIERQIVPRFFPQNFRRALRAGTVRPKKCRDCNGCGSGLPKAVHDILEGLGLSGDNVRVVKL